MVARPKTPGRTRLLCWRVLCLAAIVPMLLLALEHLSQGGGVVAAICQFRPGLSCEETLHHPAAVLQGLAVPYWAVAFYTLLFRLGPESWADRWRHRLAGIMVSGLILTSTTFLALMERDLAKPCPLCLASHLCHLLLLLTFLSAGRTPFAASSAGEHSPRPISFSLPLVILLLSSLLTLRQQGARQVEERVDSLAAPDLLSDLVHGEFDRFYPARPEHLIWGEAKAPMHLIIIGSLSCRHCRDLLRAIPSLRSEKGFRSLAISFIAFPLATACNPHLKGDPGGQGEGVGECRLARQTLQAQQQAGFWAWFAQVDQAPGRVLRRLRALPADPTTHLDQDLARQLDSLAAIPVDSVPTLLWQGQKLPASFGGLPLERLLKRLLEAEARGPAEGTPADCGC